MARCSIRLTRAPVCRHDELERDASPCDTRDDHLSDGVTLTKDAMEGVEAQLKRLPHLKKWFVDIVYTPLLSGILNYF